MLIRGVRYLDANSYRKMIITEDNFVRVDIEGDNNFSCEENKHTDILKKINNSDNNSLICDLVTYYMNYNKINCIKENVKRGNKEYLSFTSNSSELLLNIKNNKIIKCLKNKYDYDRTINLYNNNYNYYKLRENDKKSSYEVKDKDKIEIELMTLPNGKLLDYEKDFITEFLKCKLKSQGKYVRKDKETMYVSGMPVGDKFNYYLYNGNVIIDVYGDEIVSIVNSIVNEYNKSKENTLVKKYK